MSAPGRRWDAESYERGRPSYPAEAIDLLVSGLGLDGARSVLDVGAGTGKLSRQLADEGIATIGVEPSTEMLRIGGRLHPGAWVGGAAEALPIRSGSIDGIVVAQAFHWFEPSPALAELARVLRPGSGVGLVWNERDESVPWVAELTRIMHWDTCQPYAVGTDWRSVLTTGGHFGPAQRRVVSHVQLIDRAALLDRVASTSYIGLLDADARRYILSAVGELVAGFDEPFELPYRTDVYWCRRR